MIKYFIFAGFIFLLVSCTLSVELDKSSADLKVLSTLQLKATATGVFNPTTIEWSSSDTSIALVSSSGLVTSKKVGNASITAKQNNVTATCSINVFTTLKIINSTTANLDLISWNGIYFGRDSVWDSVLYKYVDGLAVGGSDEKEVDPGSYYVYFWFATGGSKYRTSSLVTVPSTSPTVFTLLGTTLVTPATSTQNRQAAGLDIPPLELSESKIELSESNIHFDLKHIEFMKSIKH